MPGTVRMKGESARDYAVRVLRHKIITLQLEPGSMVSENELAVVLGVSRTPVREALIELAKSGIVEVYPQRGSMISKIDYRMVEEARFARLVLEKAVVEQACDLAGPAHLAMLEENLHRQAYCLEHPAPEELHALDNAFHGILFAVCGKRLTGQMLASMTAHFDRVRHISLVTVKGLKIVEDHRLIVQAVAARDKVRAVALMAAHLTRYQVDEAAIRAAYPHYFVGALSKLSAVSG